jgi:hypothetical protein
MKYLHIAIKKEMMREVSLHLTTHTSSNAAQKAASYVAG